MSPPPSPAVPRPLSPPTSPQHVERCARVVRRASRTRGGVRDPAVLLAAEAILQRGLMQFPKSAFLHVLMGGFASDVLLEPTVAAGFFDRARALRPRFRERFMLFGRDREAKQKSQSATTGESSMDIVA